MYMFQTCNTDVYPTCVLHVQNYRCNIGVYPTYVLYVQNMCIAHVSTTYVIHLYFYTCNIPKTPHMQYRCNTTGHVPLDIEYGSKTQFLLLPRMQRDTFKMHKIALLNKGVVICYMASGNITRSFRYVKASPSSHSVSIHHSPLAPLYWIVGTVPAWDRVVLKLL